jgi:hypothetical protein
MKNSTNIRLVYQLVFIVLFITFWSIHGSQDKASTWLGLVNI